MISIDGFSMAIGAIGGMVATLVVVYIQQLQNKIKELKKGKKE